MSGGVVKSDGIVGPLGLDMVTGFGRQSSVSDVDSQEESDSSSMMAPRNSFAAYVPSASFSAALALAWSSRSSSLCDAVWLADAAPLSRKTGKVEDSSGIVRKLDLYIMMMIDI